jgi:hypothetical protein
MNIFDRAGGPKYLPEDTIKRKIGSLKEPKLVTFMSNAERERAKMALVNSKKGDGASAPSPFCLFAVAW